MSNQESLRMEIDDVVGRIAVHPEYSHALRLKLVGNLRAEADKHSSQIELDSEGVSASHKLRGDSLAHLDEARKFLSREGINAYSLSKLGFLVTPTTNQRRNFRNTELKFGGFSAPGPREVHNLIENFLLDINDSGLHPVQRSIGAHIGIVQIHPFVDGNGRVARLLQNHILEQRSYPPVVIPASERKLYFGLMNNVLADRYTNQTSVLSPSKAEILFGNYIEARILGSAEEVERELRRRRVYDLKITSLKDKGIAYKVKKTLAASLQRGPRSDEPVSIGKMKFPNGSLMHLTLTGDVSLADIEKVLARESRRSGFNYSVESRKTCRN